ncbi:S4 domain-containing protein [Lysinibacter sp. HNR]|uniref:RNA-binding S4 domain-containing protein n=1 Tax=Lysinibacter sp. HNR TaxID=3031408 RepID=UPI00243548EF|nr:S4 domain-containing protein [Lysinibacter sp. HNR]WGD38333.1 S4 domain-containing protein [Lysinibacter sp. HNR]
MTSPTSARVDSWIWAVRATKTRSQATTACRAGHVRVNENRVKAAQTVRVGDTVKVRIRGFDRILVVQKIITKRTSPSEAATCFEDLTPPPLALEERPSVPIRDRGAGRPTKRERRELEKLRGRSSEAHVPWSSPTPDR